MKQLLKELNIDDVGLSTEELLVNLERKQIEYLDRLDAVDEPRRREKLKKTLSEIEGAISTLSFMLDRYSNGMLRETDAENNQESESFEDLKGQAEDSSQIRKLQAPDTVGSQPIQSNSQTSKWFNEANDFLNKKQYDLAKVAIDKALSQAGGNGTDSLYSLAAEIYMNNEDNTAAMNYINKAIVERPGNPFYYLVKSRIFIQHAKGKPYTETNVFVEKGRKTIQTAIEMAEILGDSTSLGEAYGCYAYTLCFDQNPNKEEAEKYARKAKELGAEWGNAERVIAQLERERYEKERDLKEQERRKQLLQEEEERGKAAELEKKKKEERRDQHAQNSSLLWLAAWAIYIGAVCYFWKNCFSILWLDNIVPEVNVPLLFTGGFICSGLLSYASFRKNDCSWVGVIIYIIGLVFCFTVGVINAEQTNLAQSTAYWEIGGAYVVLIVVHIICKKAGKHAYGYDGS